MPLVDKEVIRSVNFRMSSHITALKSPKVAIYLLIAMIPILVYMNTLGHGFVFDDEYVLEANPYIRDPGNIPSFFVSSKTQGSYDIKAFRPLRQTLFALEYQIYALNPLGYHLVNVVLHSLATILLFVLFQLLGFRIGYAGLMSVLYSVHPLSTEVVANITGRTDLLFSIFYMAGIICYLLHFKSSKGKAYLTACVVSFCLSLFSKEMAVTFPLIIMMTELYERKGRIKEVRFHLVLLAVLLAYLALRQYAIGELGTRDYYGDSLLVTLYSETRIIFTYLKLFLFPHPLTGRHDTILIENLINPFTIAFIALMAILIALTVRNLLLRSFPLYLYGCWWFFITLLPVSNIIPIRGAMMGERFMYIMMPGLIIAIFSLLERALTPRQGRLRKIVFASITVVAVIFAGLSVRRNQVWKDNLTFFEDARSKAPNSLVVHWNLFREYNERGDRESAARMYSQMVRINTNAALGHLRTARKYRDTGRLEDAERMALKALKTKSDLTEAKEFLLSIGREP